MGEHSSPSAVQLSPEWIEREVAQVDAVIATGDCEAVGVELISRPHDLTQARLWIIRRQECQHAKACRMLSNEACRIVVHATYIVERLGIRCNVAEQLQLDTTPVHVREDLVGIPTRRLLRAPATLLHRLQTCLSLFFALRCIEVSVCIDPSIQLHGDLL